jgi:hypothetical protein
MPDDDELSGDDVDGNNKWALYDDVELDDDLFPEGDAFLDFDSPDADKLEFRQMFKGPTNLDEVSINTNRVKYNNQNHNNNVGRNNNNKPLMYAFYEQNHPDTIHYVIRDTNNQQFDSSHDEMIIPYLSAAASENAGDDNNNNELTASAIIKNDDQNQNKQQMSSSASFARPQVMMPSSLSPTVNFQDMLYFTPEHQREIEHAAETHVHVMHSKSRMMRQQRKDRSNNNINNRRRHQQFDQADYSSIKPPPQMSHAEPLKISAYPTFSVVINNNRNKPIIINNDPEPSGSHTHTFQVSPSPSFNNNKFRKNRQHAEPANFRNFNHIHNTGHNYRQSVNNRPFIRRH